MAAVVQKWLIIFGWRLVAATRNKAVENRLSTQSGRRPKQAAAAATAAAEAALTASVVL